MMKKALLTVLREASTTRPAFRLAAEQLSLLLAGECGNFLDTTAITVKTPLADAAGEEFNSDIVLIAILRAGLAMLPQFLRFYPQSSIGLFGMRRDEKTKKPELYYHNLPEIKASQNIIILDPMIATGGSGIMALQKLMEAGAAEEKIIYSGIIAAPAGLQNIQKHYPKVRIHVSAVDESLNKDAFIVPGIGDFGDRFFGT